MNNDYMEYIKCGEVLISPTINYKEQYILKCSECNEYFSFWDSFLHHALVHSNEKEIEIKCNASDEIDVPDDPLYQTFNDLGHVIKLEVNEPVVAGDSPTHIIEFCKTEDRSYAGINTRPQSSNDRGYVSTGREYASAKTPHETPLEINKESIVEYQRIPMSEKSGKVKKSFACDECGEIMKTINNMKTHKRMHMQEKNKEPEDFKKSSSSSNHMKKPNSDSNDTAESINGDDDSDSEDDVCDWESQIYAPIILKNKKANNKVAINVKSKEIKRQKEDHKKKEVICPECGKLLKTRKTFKRHLRIHMRQPGQKEEAKEKFECEICKKVYQLSRTLKDHLRTHTGEYTPYLCSECGKAFTNYAYLKQHLLRHGTGRPYECPDCPKTFRCRSDLASHKIIHSKDAKSQHVCDICGKGFPLPYLLKRHKMYHNGEKNHKCDYCDMRFVLAERCRRHMRTHTGEKPYKCKYCIRAYAQSNDLIKHLRGHLGDNVYKCNMCPQGFRLLCELRAHFNTHKNDDEETKLRNLQALKDDELRIQMKLGLVQADDKMQ